jgi:putative membrane protein
MITLVKWRIATAKCLMVDTSHAAAFSRISIAQALLVIGMVFAATAMARGFGLR